jgi:hypothetical protein
MISLVGLLALPLFFDSSTWDRTFFCDLSHLVVMRSCLGWLAQYRVNARSRLNERLRPCRVDHAKNGSSQNRQIRCDGMNFDTPASPLRVSVDVIATIIFGPLGHWTTDSFPLDATPPTGESDPCYRR